MRLAFQVQVMKVMMSFQSAYAPLSVSAIESDCESLAAAFAWGIPEMIQACVGVPSTVL